MFLEMFFQVFILVFLSVASHASKYFITKDRFTWREAMDVSMAMRSSMSAHCHLRLRLCCIFEVITLKLLYFHYLKVAVISGLNCT